MLYFQSDLRNNEITEIEDGALEGADVLQDLLLSSNQMKQIRPKMFAGLRNLTTLYVSFLFLFILKLNVFLRLDFCKITK